MKPPAQSRVVKSLPARLSLLVALTILWSGHGWPSLAQSNPSAPAVVADRFLSGIESRDLVERERLLAGILWQTGAIDHPPLEDATFLGERFFGTDIVRVRGYERLVVVTIPVNGGARFTRTYRLVAYPDRVSRKWKIWSFEEGDDVETAVAFWAPRAGPINSPATIGATVRYAQCLASSGHLQDAANAYRSVIEATSGGLEVDIAATSAADAMHSLEQIVGTGVR